MTPSPPLSPERGTEAATREPQLREENTMKCVSVDVTKVAYEIAVRPEPYPHVRCGEKGRGREEGRIGLSVAAWGTPLPTHITQCSLGKNLSGNPVLLPSSEDDGLWFVQNFITGGFRGSCRIVGDVRSVTCPNAGQVLDDLTCPECGAITERPTEAGADLFRNRRHPEAPSKAVITDIAEKKEIRILASGQFAEGDAGRAGGPHESHLLILPVGSFFAVVRNGRLYGTPKYIFCRAFADRVVVGPHGKCFPEEHDRKD